jgi:hypothetical protein
MSADNLREVKRRALGGVTGLNVFKWWEKVK